MIWPVCCVVLVTMSSKVQTDRKSDLKRLPDRWNNYLPLVWSSLFCCWAFLRRVKSTWSGIDAGLFFDVGLLVAERPSWLCKWVKSNWPGLDLGPSMFSFLCFVLEAKERDESSFHFFFFSMPIEKEGWGTFRAPLSSLTALACYFVCNDCCTFVVFLLRWRPARRWR